jgi:peptidoglycan/LPS O-acetylase OafA/YrhL
VRGEVGHLPAVEGLRGITVAWVIAFHYLAVRGAEGKQDAVAAWVDSIEPLARILRNGYLGVDLFFLITGFLLVLPWIRHAEMGLPPPSARAFYRRRILRIVPAYWVHLALLALVFIPLVAGADAWARAWRFYLFNFALHAPLLHYTTPLTSASMSVNGALWTLALEAQWYLLLPFIAPLFARRPHAVAAALVALALAWRWLAAHDLGPLVRFHMGLAAIWNVPEQTIRHFLATQLPGYFAHFAFGMLAGRAWWRWRHQPAAQGAAAVPWLLLAAAGLAFLYVIHIPGSFRFGLPAWLAVAVALALPFVALVARGTPVTGALLANPPLAFLGRISYSAYLYHLPVLLALDRHAALPPAALAPLYLALVTAVAWASWRCVEAPFMRSGPGAGAHRERGGDGERLQRRHPPQHEAVAPGIHERAEGERRDREPRVDA